MESGGETSPPSRAGSRWSLTVAPILLIVLLSCCLILQSVTLLLRGTGANQPISGGGTTRSAGTGGPCPEPWILMHNKCYFFSEVTMSREDSERNCTSGGSTLAQVPTGKGTLQRLIRITGQEFWVGIKDVGSHYSTGIWKGRWDDGREETLPTGTGTCAKMGGTLILENCYTPLRWICERHAP
ncbi:C-type lectin domain family 2 member L-like [Xenopus tropicalis]|nr:C-type lectin domain family 2 member L-like [Xenopus tropicalis]